LNSRKERLLAFQPQFHAVHRQHAVDAEMPADIAQEGDVEQPVQPFGIVEHDGIRRAITETQEGVEHLADAGLVGFDLRIRPAAGGASSRKEGSPTLVVPPPISTTGDVPVRCISRSSMICTRDPTCRLSAVASKPI
jgi:hypothetical protein